ncbi:hypothetical protein JW319_10785 [Enterobacter cloacae subsp. cloacae]|uniref:hypothetical protein n=1 Tax=Enterobacter cloacae TaxID=550 RepID=UPI001C5ABFBA|nr:hypothetical protein [Enterobacter cloacae]MBW4201859.1 hypothetical protein [Enterobacter cloacae subsp. cloacae]
MPVSDVEKMSHREMLAVVVDDNYTPGSVYIPAVGCINRVLQHIGVGLSQRAYKGISDNVRQVHTGTKSEAASSIRESALFALDTFNALSEGRFSDAMVSVSGSAINATVGMLYFSNYDRERLSAHGKIFFDSMHL